MTPSSDVFGRALLDWSRGGTSSESYERRDGFTTVGAGAAFYFAGFRRWPPAERRSMRFVRGRVVDVGCGGGRVALHLQQRGFAVVGLDSSPLAARTARRRGVNDVWCAPFGALTREIRAFDTIVLFGNNFGIFGTAERAHAVLARWGRTANPGTRILAESINPYGGGAPGVDRAHYHRNKQRGTPPGETRLRIRYGQAVGPWFSWLFVSRHEMRAIVRGTGWRMVEILGSRASEPFVAVLEKA